MSEVPKLEGWLTFPEIAERAGVTKQLIHKEALENDAFESLRAVGSKPVYVVQETEVEQWLETRRQAKEAREQRKADREAAAARRKAEREAKEAEAE